MHDDFVVDMLPNLYVHWAETFIILGAGILLPTSFTVVVSENNTSCPLQKFLGPLTNNFSRQVITILFPPLLLLGPHVLWPNTPLVFLFHPRFVSLMSPVTFLTLWTYKCHPPTPPQQIVPLPFPTPDVISVCPILSASSQFSLA